MTEPNRIDIITLPPDDWQVFRRIRLESLLDSPQAYTSTYTGMVDRPESFWRGRLEDARQAEQSWMLFARAGGEVVGMTGAFRDAENPALATVVSVYVTPSARGRGTAAMLMTAILAALKEKGVQTARLNVTLGQDAALRLYQRHGFQIVKRESAVMGDGKFHDEYLMEKKIE